MFYDFNFLFFMIDIVQEDLNLEVWTMAPEEVKTVKMTTQGTLVERKFMRISKVWIRKNMSRQT